MAKQTAELSATETITTELKGAGLTITPEILQLIAAVVAPAVAAAVKESSRDETKEKAKLDEEANRERVRQEELQRVANIRARQNACPHLDAYENYAFVGQRSCEGKLVFICSQCFRPFKPGDEDYNNFVRYVKLDRIGNARLNM